MKTNKRAVSVPPPGSRNQTSSAASAAAALAFTRKQGTDAINLSAAAAAAALRSHMTTPVPVGEIQTKRMARRGSTSSFGSNTGSIRQAFGGRPGGLQRRTSSSSMTERTFRSPSPGPRRSRAPSIISISEDPVPALPSKSQIRSAGYDPQTRLTMASPTPSVTSTSSRLPPARKGAAGGTLPKVVEQRERETDSTDTRRSVNFSRPMSPGPTSTAPRQAVKARPASSQGFYPVQNPRNQPQQAQGQRQTPAAKNFKSTRAESIMEEPAEGTPARTAASASARPMSATPRSRTATTPATIPAKPVIRPAAQTTAKPPSQSSMKPAARPTSSISQSSPQTAARPASAMSQPRVQTAARPASAMAHTKTQPPPRPASAMAHTRTHQPAWPPTALVQQKQQQQQQQQQQQKQQQTASRPSSAMSQVRSTMTGPSPITARTNGTSKVPQNGPERIVTSGIATQDAVRIPATAAQSASSPITVPSPTQEQMRVFQTRAAAMLSNSPQNMSATGRPTNLPISNDRQAGPYQATRPVITKRASSSSITNQKTRSASQSLTNLVPAGVNVRRTPSASPARSARFSSAPLLDTIKHQPPPRAISPAKSSLKPASLRTSSPESSYIHGTSDNSDSRSVRSVESKRKPRVNFDETPTVLEPTKGLTSTTKSMWMAETAPDMGRTPALPSFESIRGRKTGREVPIVGEQPFTPASTGTVDRLPQITDMNSQPSANVGGSSVNAVSANYPDGGHLTEEERDLHVRHDTLSLAQNQEEIGQSSEDVPHISVVPATPRLDEDIKSSTPATSLAPIVDDGAVAPMGDTSASTVGADIRTDESTDATVARGPYASPITQPNHVNDMGTSDFVLPPVGPGAYAPGTRELNFIPGVYTHGSTEPMLAEVHDSETRTTNTEPQYHEEDLDETIQTGENHVDKTEEDSEIVDGENKTLSAIIETPITEDPSLSQTHPAFRGSNYEGREQELHASASAASPEHDWERVRAYWSSLSEQRKQQLEHEAGITREREEQLGSSELAHDERGQHVLKIQQSNNRSAGNQAPLPPWPDQQYQQSVKGGAAMQQQPMRPNNQRMPSDPSKARPQSAQIAPRTTSSNSVRPVSVSGDSPSKTAPPMASKEPKPLKGVLKNANAPQPPLARTFSNDSSDSDSSFRKARKARKSGMSNHSMKRSMRPQAPQLGGSYDGRPTSPTPQRANTKRVSPSPSQTELNRPLRTSMRAPTQPGQVVRAPQQNFSKPAAGGFAKPAKTRPPSKAASKFKSRFDDSSDEDVPRPAKRKNGGGVFGGGGGAGFRSRFVDSDEETSPIANGHAQGSSLMSGTMRNSVDGGSPQKRKLFGAGKKKNEAGIVEETEHAPASPSKYSKMLASMRQPEQDQTQSSSRPNVFRRMSLSRSAQSISGAGAVDESVPVPSIPAEYREESGGMTVATAPLSNGNRQEIVSTRTGKKKRFQGLRRVLGLND